MNIFQIVLTSSLISGIVSAIISYYFNLKIKKLDYKNEYYKILINKRLEAYQFVENQISVLRNITFDELDNKTYHIMFSFGEDECINFQKNLMIAKSKGLWIDEETTNTIDEFNEIFYNINQKINNKTEIEIENIGKNYYKKISNLRVKLENNLREGLNDLHNIEKIFRTQKIKNKYLKTEH